MVEPNSNPETGNRPGAFQRFPLGEIDPARSRHMWTRSAVHATDGLVVTGQWDGTVTAFDRDGAADSIEREPRWSVDHPEHAVGIATLEADDIAVETDARTADTQVVVAGRGERGTIAAYDADTGDRRWHYDTAEDVGSPSNDSVFYLPYVVTLATDDETGRLYAAARRYERDGETRQWHSSVLAFDADGTVLWRYETDASPIALDLATDGKRLAVGYNRCMGEHDTGLVVLDAESGSLQWTWDPGTEGDRRVGDVSFDGESIAVASHGDKRGYLLGPRGAERWHVDLATETEIDGETLYAYPNHVLASDGYVAFVTGNTYAVESRETENRHPNEHRLAVFDATGVGTGAAGGNNSNTRDDPELLWDDSVRGFVHGLDLDRYLDPEDGTSTLVVPCAQNFRVRDPETHAVRWYVLESGERGCERLDGIATAAAVDGGTVAAIEEPVTYHDDGETRGEYVLRVGSLA